MFDTVVFTECIRLTVADDVQINRERLLRTHIADGILTPRGTRRLLSRERTLQLALF
jgi:hypothetical protein